MGGASDREVGEGCEMDNVDLLGVRWTTSPWSSVGFPDPLLDFQVRRGPCLGERRFDNESIRCFFVSIVILSFFFQVK